MSSDRKKKYLNRDISWMYFNDRILHEAANSGTPLIERLRFLGIYSNNLDEFYRVRVASLSRLALINYPFRFDYPDNPKKILKKIAELASRQQKKFESLYDEILKEFAEKNIRFINEKQVNEKQADFIGDFFSKKLINVLNPIMLSRRRKFLHLTDAAIYLVVALHNTEKVVKNYALVEIPNDYPRFLILPQEGENKYIMLLDDVIRFCLPELFRNLGYRYYSAYTIKITRDAEMDLDPDKIGSLPEKILKGVKGRKTGEPVRLVYDRDLPDTILKFIARQSGLSLYDAKAPGGRYHNFKDFMHFPDLAQNELIYEPWPPISIKYIDNAPNMIDLIKKDDIGIHFPYHDFSHFIRLIREAAIDPYVRSIKITMYRLASNSRIVRALINAAQNGKKVTAVVELLARFDETANIDWAQRMQDAGIDVEFGHERLKIHSKLVHISRKNGDIACISTGNFHEGNACVYTDVMLMTADSNITDEVENVFKIINNPYLDADFNHLLVSPHNMRLKINELLTREMKFAKQGKPAYMMCKINHVTDYKLIDKIYAAAKAGVKIRMMVRGNCSLVNCAGDNLQVTGIVDRYLEHSRIYVFGNGGNEVGYISSADWMTRNLDHRIEVSVPLYSEKILNHFKKVIEYGLNDNVKAVMIDGSGNNEYVSRDSNVFRSQFELYDYYKKHDSEYFSPDV